MNDQPIGAEQAFNQAVLTALGEDLAKTFPNQQFSISCPNWSFDTVAITVDDSKGTPSGELMSAVVRLAETHLPITPVVHQGRIATAAPASRPTLQSYCEQVLAEAHSVLVERGANYADIADNSRVFAQIMTAIGVVRPPDMTEVEFHCLANIATKLARYATGNKRHEDTFVDLSNYATLILADMRRVKAR